MTATLTLVHGNPSGPHLPDPFNYRWMDGGVRCTGQMTTFFPPGEALTYHRGQRRPDYGPAKEICATCPVRAECLYHGLREVFGVFGGMDPIERRVELQRRQRAGEPVPPPYFYGDGTNW